MPPVTASPLEVRVGDLTFKTPIFNASGAFNPDLFAQLFSLKATLGGIVTKTVTQNPLIGNPQSRTVELPGVGMLNSIGLQNPGLDYFLNTEAPKLTSHQVPVILSISAHSPEAFAQMAKHVLSHPNGHVVHLLELNLSCPNVEKGGVEFGTVPELVKEAVSAVTHVFERPVLAKLSPNVNTMVPMAGAALEGGAFGITAINTVFGAAIDIKRKKTILPRVSGGYSGPGIKPIALHHVIQLYKNFPDVFIMGVGGISTAEDVLEFMLAGASCVQVGTQCFRSPMIFKELMDKLSHYCQQEGLAHISDLRGAALD